MGLFTQLVSKGSKDLAKTLDEGIKVEREYYSGIIKEAKGGSTFSETVKKGREMPTAKER